jgi:hypothetical protein
LIAETFQSINYPILPLRGQNDSIDNKSGPSKEDLSTAVLVKDAKGEVPLYYKRHFTHFTPRDFDLSPYFEIIKPTIEHGFDHHVLHFKEDSDA